jgi:hypothetical protein
MVSCIHSGAIGEAANEVPNYYCQLKYRATSGNLKSTHSTNMVNTPITAIVADRIKAIRAELVEIATDRKRARALLEDRGHVRQDAIECREACGGRS